ncbi:MAG: hypothetical protein R3327_07790 [Nitrosopumilaceae archaeon]|nr:hypothetical protein [Nitrosopumilaceae archaeon]
MSLKDLAKNAFENFDNTDTDEIQKILEQIQTKLTSNLTQEYLQEKIKSLQDADSEQEKRKLCQKLKPYLDWYVQGA